MWPIEKVKKFSPQLEFGMLRQRCGLEERKIKVLSAIAAKRGKKATGISEGESVGWGEGTGVEKMPNGALVPI